MKLGEVLGDKLGVVEAAFANVAIDGGERDDDGWSLDGWEGCVEDFGKGASKGAHGLIFEIVDELTDEVGAVTDDKNGRKARAVWALAGGGRSCADGTVVLVVFDDVFFTTVAKWVSQRTTTPTGVRSE